MDDDLELTHEYRFLARSIYGENNAFDIPKSRLLKDLNLIVIVGQQKEISEHYYQEATRFFVKEEVQWFLLVTIAAAVVMATCFALLSISLVRVHVISPLLELTAHVRRPHDAEEIQTFLTNLRKYEYQKKFARQEWIKA